MRELKKGFTLAEVLITLLIIGVIASIVIPGLIADTQKIEYKTALKKVYSDLSQASLMIRQDNGGTFRGIFPDNDTFHSGTASGFPHVFGKYISMSRMCGTSGSNVNDSNPCWHVNGKWFDSSGNPMSGCDGCQTFYTSNGYWATGSGVVGSCSLNDAPNNIVNACVSYILVDINGIKKPNKINTDIFYFYIAETGIKPYKSTSDFLTQQ